MKVRQTVRFVKRSAVAGRYIFPELSSSGARVFRQILDVKKRWGSTAAMVKSFLYLEPFIGSAVGKMYSDNVMWTGSGPADRLLRWKKLKLKIIVELLTAIEESTTMLGSQSGPKMHLKGSVVQEF